MNEKGVVTLYIAHPPCVVGTVCRYLRIILVYPPTFIVTCPYTFGRDEKQYVFFSSSGVHSFAAASLPEGDSVRCSETFPSLSDSDVLLNLVVSSELCPMLSS